MSWGKMSLSWAVIALVLCLRLSVVESQGVSLDGCPGDITADRSSVVYWSPPTASGGSGSFTVFGTHQSGRYHYQTTTVNYTATDGTDTITCNFDIIIQDNGSPVITSCPTDTEATAPPGATSVSVTYNGAPMVEDMANVMITPDKSPGSQFTLGRNTVTYTFTYTNYLTAKSSYCSFDIFVKGGGPVTIPILRCPDPIVVMLEVGQDSMPISWDDPTYPTGLGSVTTMCARNKDDQFFEGRNEIVCVGYFESGANDMCSFHVQINAHQDDQNPSILACPEDIMKYVSPSVTGIMVLWDTPTITDNNELGLQLVPTHTNGIFYNVSDFEVVYTGTDASSNSVDCRFHVTIEVDDAVPIFDNCPDPLLTKYVQAGEISGTVSWPELTATDNNPNSAVRIDGPMVTPQQLINGGTLNVGETRTVTYTATDDFNNIQTCEFMVTLSVDQVPNYNHNCPGDTFHPADMGVSYTNVTWVEPRVTDDLSEGKLNLTKSYEPGMRFEIGVYKVSYTATDELQNVGTCDFILTITDEQKPVLNDCPVSQTIVLDQFQSTTNVAWTDPTVADNSCDARSNCDTVLTITSNEDPGFFSSGNYTVVITVKDFAMNIETCIFEIVISPYVPDTIRPMYNDCPLDYEGFTNSGEPTYEYSWTPPTVSDDRGLVYTYKSHDPPFKFPIADTTVLYEARDAAGNEEECRFVVSVRDNEAPMWDANTGCETTLTYFVLVSGNLNLPIPTPTATDNSGVTPTITNTLTNQTSFLFNTEAQGGQYNFEYMATDGLNTVGDCSARVIVTVDSNAWNLRGSVTMTRIRSVGGSFTDAFAVAHLSNLRYDMEQLFRRSSIGSHFVGVEIVSHMFTGGNPRVEFRLHFSKLREGRHTSRQIETAFYDAIGSTLSFAVNNFVLAGSLDFHVREFKLTSTIIQLDNTANPPFLSQYNDPESSQYTMLETKINDALDATFTGFFGYQVSVLNALRDGSIINDEILIFNDISQTTEPNIVGQFNTRLDLTGQVPGTGLYFNAIATAENQEVCPTNECQNGGTCAYDITYTNMCTCAEGYSGTNCEIEPSTIVLSPLAIAAIIGGGILLLLLLLALCCCCIYFCREPYKDGMYREQPFQIVDDEESVVSSVDVFMMPRERLYRESMPLALPPAPPILALAPPPPPPPPPEAPILRLEDDFYPMEEDLYRGRHNDAFAMDAYSSEAPSFTPDGEIYVTGPNQVAIRPSTKRSDFYHY